MRNKLGTLLMAAGTLMILAALALLLTNQQEDRTAQKSAESALTQIADQLQTQKEEAQEAAQAGEAPLLPDPYDPEMTEAEIDGYRYIGALTIPAFELELPIMSDWSYPQLKLSPCRFQGSTKTDDLILMAHNYSRHFGKLKDLVPGDTVYFTDMDGVTTQYEVILLETLQPYAMEELISAGYDLTLFTCTYGGQSRVTVRLDRVTTE